jgi:hypothetical protein
VAVPLSRLQRKEALLREVARIDTRFAELAQTITVSTNVEETRTAIEERAKLETERAACVAATTALGNEIEHSEKEEAERLQRKWAEELQPEAVAEIAKAADLVASRLEVAGAAYEDLCVCEARWKTKWAECGRPGERAFKSQAARSLADMLGVAPVRDRATARAHGPRAQRFYEALSRANSFAIKKELAE